MSHTPQPIQDLRAPLLDAVIESLLGWWPGYINDHDLYLADELIEAGLAEEPGGAGGMGEVRITRRGWDAAVYHSNHKTRLHRTDGVRCADEDLPETAIPAYLEEAR